MKSPNVKPVGKRYGKLTVLGYESPQGWRVRCECGVEKHYNGNNLRSGQYTSCGCSRYLRLAARTRERHQAIKSAAKTKARAVRHFKSGTRCWVCRNRTGKSEPVALCQICEGAP